MTNFLLHLFVKGSDDMSDPATRGRCGRFAGVVGICTNLLLFAVKLIAGTLSHSIAITADAVNNLSDSASSVITLLGFRLASKPADREHPYGHARFEYISSLVVSILIFVVGAQFARDSIQKIFQPEHAEFSVLTACILGFSILVKLWQGSFYRAVGKKTGSETMTAAAADSRSDVFTTSVVLAGALITSRTGLELDGYMGLAVAVFILVTGFRLIRSTSDPLLGEAPPKQLVDDIYHTIRRYDGVIGVHDLTVHDYGPGRCFASVHCEVPAERNILVSHDIIDCIEHDFLTEKGIHLVIHMDPIVTDDPRTNQLRDEIHAMVTDISPELTAHDFRVVWGQTHSNLVFDVCAPFGFSMSDRELAAEIKKRVKTINPHYYAVITVDHDYVPKESETKN